MNCEQVPEAVSARVDGELDGPEALQLDEHLGACPDCARETALLEETAAGTAAILRAKASELPEPAERSGGLRMAPAAAIAAAVLLAFGVFLFLPPESAPPAEQPETAAAAMKAVESLDRSVSEISAEWDQIKQDLHQALLRVRERGVEVDIPDFLSES